HRPAVRRALRVPPPGNAARARAGMSRAPLSADARRVVAAQALRAFAYGFGALLLGTTLKRRGFSSTEVGVVLGAVVAGTIVSSLPGDQSFFWLFVPVALAGAVVARALSASLEAPVTTGPPTGRTRRGPSRPTVVRRAALFATDAFGGGFVVQAFIAYWFSVKF